MTGQPDTRRYTIHQTEDGPQITTNQGRTETSVIPVHGKRDVASRVRDGRSTVLSSTNAADLFNSFLLEPPTLSSTARWVSGRDIADPGIIALPEFPVPAFPTITT